MRTWFWSLPACLFLAIPLVAVAEGPADKAHARLAEVFPPPEDQGGWKSLLPDSGTPDAAAKADVDADDAPVSVTLIQPTAADTPYPEHAANYLSQAAKLPTPMIEPEKVAGAILDAATEGARDVKVGAMSTLNTTMAKIMPALGESMAKMQIGRQQRDELLAADAGQHVPGVDVGAEPAPRPGHQGLAQRRGADGQRVAGGVAGRGQRVPHDLRRRVDGRADRQVDDAAGVRAGPVAVRRQAVPGELRQTAARRPTRSGGRRGQRRHRGPSGLRRSCSAARP